MGIFENLSEHFSKSKPSASTGPSHAQILSALSNVIDPDLHRDIVSLGFIKDLKFEHGKVSLTLELTTPACPVKDALKKECEDRLLEVEGVLSTQITITAQTRGHKISNVNTADALGQVKNIIAVASGKGGVAKSTTAVNLAYALAQSGSQVGLMDADVYGPSLVQMTGADKPTHAQGKLIIPPEKDGVKIVSVAMFHQAESAAILRGPMISQIIKQFLSQIAWGELDYLIIDYPPGTGDVQLTISQMVPVTAAVVVTTPQEVALSDVRRCVDMFKTLKVPILGVIETMSYFICNGCEKKHFIFKQGGGDQLAKNLGVKLLGQIPIDPSICVAADSGSPAVNAPQLSLAAHAYKSAAGEVARSLVVLHNKNNMQPEHHH